MIKENQKHFNRLQVAIDAFVIAVSYFMAWFLKFHLPFLSDGGGRLPFRIYMSALQREKEKVSRKFSRPTGKNIFGIWRQNF